jgi:hypothetical protein
LSPGFQGQPGLHSKALYQRRDRKRGEEGEGGGERERERVNKNVYSMYTECYLFIQQIPVKYLVNFKLYARDDNNKVWSLPLTC